jgi:hypothetical protein
MTPERATPVTPIGQLVGANDSGQPVGIISIRDALSIVLPAAEPNAWMAAFRRPFHLPA